MEDEVGQVNESVENLDFEASVLSDLEVCEIDRQANVLWSRRYVYDFLINRLEKIQNIEIAPCKSPGTIREVLSSLGTGKASAVYKTACWATKQGHRMTQMKPACPGARTATRPSQYT